MNKADFIVMICQLSPKYDLGDRESYSKQKGYYACKEEILKLAEELDESGLTGKGLQLLKQVTTDLTTAYTEIHRIAGELFDANKQIQLLTCDNQELRQEINNLLQKQRENENQ